MSFFPLGGFTPLQSSTLDEAAAELGTAAMVVALAWLPQQSANLLLIPVTSSVAHLRENLSAPKLELPGEAERDAAPVTGLVRDRPTAPALLGISIGSRDYHENIALASIRAADWHLRASPPALFARRAMN